MTGDLDGKVAVVTGAAAPTGIGAETARLFAEHGASVVIADIDDHDGETTAASLRAAGHACEFVRADVTDESQVARMVAVAREQFGPIDVAVNNAAVMPDDRPVASLDLEQWSRVLAVNLTGVALCLKHELRDMLQHGTKGSIVNIASIRGFRPQAGRPAYVSAKHGLVGLSKNAAIENGQHGIRVNAVAPGSVDTPMYRHALRTFGLVEADYVDEVSLLGRVGRPEEIAEAALWLCSDRSAFVTAATIHVDGGYTHR